MHADRQLPDRPAARTREATCRFAVSELSDATYKMKMDICRSFVASICSRLSKCLSKQQLATGAVSGQQSMGCNITAKPLDCSHKGKWIVIRIH
jgi:hypothetical protein